MRRPIIAGFAPCLSRPLALQISRSLPTGCASSTESTCCSASPSSSSSSSSLPPPPLPALSRAWRLISSRRTTILSSDSTACPGEMPRSFGSTAAAYARGLPWKVSPPPPPPLAAAPRGDACALAESPNAAYTPRPSARPPPPQPDDAS
eukprot:3118399-Prymnesium_polylepis.2